VRAPPVGATLEGHLQDAEVEPDLDRPAARERPDHPHGGVASAHAPPAQDRAEVILRAGKVFAGVRRFSDGTTA
jgi:hypothetical protein